MKELRRKLIDHMADSHTKKLFYASMGLVLVSKSLAIASPWFLKGVVDSMTAAHATNAALNMHNIGLGIGGFGMTRFLSTVFQEMRMF